MLDDRRTATTSYYEEAVLSADGGVSVEGQDVGADVESFFGPGATDYEWFYDVPADRVPLLITALGGSLDDDVLDLIAAYYRERGGAALGKLMAAEPIDADFTSYHG